ncbi:MAG: hypothetical protein Q8P18_01670 [Pseudomonadota bacterium]|nr:hypothetical protein [Pseudomonadota bacterium]
MSAGYQAAPIRERGPPGYIRVIVDGGVGVRRAWLWHPPYFYGSR